jgi:hypothetical protein
VAKYCSRLSGFRGGIRPFPAARPLNLPERAGQNRCLSPAREDRLSAEVICSLVPLPGKSKQGRPGPGLPGRRSAIRETLTQLSEMCKDLSGAIHPWKGAVEEYHCVMMPIRWLHPPERLGCDRTSRQAAGPPRGYGCFWKGVTIITNDTTRKTNTSRGNKYQANRLSVVLAPSIESRAARSPLGYMNARRYFGALQRGCDGIERLFLHDAHEYGQRLFARQPADRL